jgi:hypothetical protein
MVFLLQNPLIDLLHALVQPDGLFPGGHGEIKVIIRATPHRQRVSNEGPGPSYGKPQGQIVVLHDPKPFVKTTAVQQEFPSNQHRLAKEHETRRQNDRRVEP